MSTSGSAVGSLRTTQSIVSNGGGGGGGGGGGNSLSGYMKSRPSGASLANTVTTTRDGRIVIGANTAASISADVSTSPNGAMNATSATQQQQQQQQPAVSSASPPCSSTMHATSTDDVAAPVSSTPNTRGGSISPSSTGVTATTTAPIVKSGRSSAPGAAAGDSAYSPTPIQRPQGTPSEIRTWWSDT